MPSWEAWREVAGQVLQTGDPLPEAPHSGRKNVRGVQLQYIEVRQGINFGMKIMLRRL